MIPAWWLIPALMLGAFIGITLVALCSAGRTDNEREQDDEQHEKGCR